MNAKQKMYWLAFFYWMNQAFAGADSQIEITRSLSVESTAKKMNQAMLRFMQNKFNVELVII